MRAASLLIVMLALVSCADECTRPEGEQEPAWRLYSDSLNVAVLLVDHETPEFLGANVSHYAPCDDCPPGMVPLYELPSRVEDMVIYAWLSFETSEVVFWATREYGGKGHISYPDSFLPAALFESVQDTIPMPQGAELLEECRKTPTGECLAQARTAWQAVADRDIVAEFADFGMTVGFFKYGTDLAAIDSTGIWVFFICCGGGSD